LFTHKKRTTCRACNNTRLRTFLDLGSTPLANSFLSSFDDFVDETSYPLEVYFCEDCSLVQLLDVISPEVLFKNYIYVTGTSDTIREHNQKYAQTVVDLLKMDSCDLVVEVASNDGSLLKCFQQHGLKVLGIEPAANIAEMANVSGVESLNEFFSSSVAEHVRKTHGLAKVVIGNNVLAHVDDTRDFLKGCKTLISDDGLVVIEVPYLGELIHRKEFDTIYHEHLCYFSVTALLKLYESVDLSIVRVDRVSVHGGSLRIYAGSRETYKDHSKKVLAWKEEEKTLGLTRFSEFVSFAEKVKKSRQDIVGMLEDLNAQGKRVAGYGAPAKGNTLLNYCGIGPELISYTVDKNSLKVGMYTPGMHIPVLPVSTLLERQPDYVFILAWNFAEEIMDQQTEYRSKGGRFIVPIPEPKIV